MILALALLAIIAGSAAIVASRLRITIFITRKTDMAAIDDLNAAVANVTNYVATLKTDLANADQTPAIEAATAALNAVVPADPDTSSLVA